MSRNIVYPLVLVAPPSKTESEIINHLKDHLKNRRYKIVSVVDIEDLKKQRDELKKGGSLDYEIDELLPLPPESPEHVVLSFEDTGKIKRRSKRLFQNLNAHLAHVENSAKERLQPIWGGVKSINPGTEHWADEIASALHEEMPWMGPATEHAWLMLRRIAQREEPVTFKPFLLNGNWGIGKSAWARRLAELINLPTFDIDASKGGAGFALVGTEKGWGSAQPGRPVEFMIEKRCINPLCIVDEICKAQFATSKSGVRTSFSDSLLALMEPSTARHWECPYFRLPFDMSKISWVLTSNTLNNVNAALLSRCQIIELPDVQPDQLVQFAERRGRQMQLSPVSIDAVSETLVIAPSVVGRRFSLRDAIRMLERAQALENRPLYH